MNDELSDDIKKKFILPLTIELQDHKEKVFHNALVSHSIIWLLFANATLRSEHDFLLLILSVERSSLLLLTFHCFLNENWKNVSTRLWHFCKSPFLANCSENVLQGVFREQKFNFRSI